MKLDSAHAGSGTHVVDFYRDSKGQAAANAINAGYGLRCVAGDHVGSETCAETIARNSTNPAKAGGSDNTLLDGAIKAVNNLRAGIGVHKVAGDHSSNTCVAVIAAAV